MMKVGPIYQAIAAIAVLGLLGCSRTPTAPMEHGPEHATQSLVRRPEPICPASIRIDGQQVAWYDSSIVRGMYDLRPPTSVTYSFADKRVTIVASWEVMPAPWTAVPDRSVPPQWTADVALVNHRARRGLSFGPTHDGHVYAYLPSGQIVWATITRVGETLRFSANVNLEGETFDRVIFTATRYQPQIPATTWAYWRGRLAPELVADR